ncbi:MAG TPA: Fe-S cluster assembly protein SufB [Candidatus Nanoarchaeia archaeon]|nr:Fe-S cluster assembly protein SufB [Candidatus Nanoarchaeia archaeon]
MTQTLEKLKENYEEKYGFHDPETAVFRTEKGLNETVVRQISKIKGEPEWMLNNRLKALNAFIEKKMPTWGADLSTIKFDEITYYLRPTDKPGNTWEEVPDEIKNTFEKLGIPEAERKFLGGVGAQYDSESVYHKLNKKLEEQGVVFLDMDVGLKKYPEIVKKYFGTVIPIADNKFAALNTAVWSGGSFIYVPKGVHVDIPLQAYFRINAKNFGQFERTLIIADEGSSVHYVEGCTAPVYSTDSLHAAVVELIALKDAKIRYTTIQNWSNNVYNLVTKRAYAYEGAVVEWIDGNLGSKITMKYPSVFLLGRGAKADILSIAFAGSGQHQDAGGKAVHMASDTTSTIISKSISMGTGRATYRGQLRVDKGAQNVKSQVNCDALLLDETSKTDTYPYIEIEDETATIGHEATVGKIGEDQIFYLTSRGLKESEAKAMIVQGFIEPFTKLLPMEYAIELNRLIQLEMEGSVG